MLRSLTYIAVGLLTIGSTVNAATILFDTDPFAGTNALTTPGRQIVGNPGTDFTFNIGSDVLAFDIGTFGVNQISFANGLSGDIPATGVNFVVLQDGPPLGAGAAASAIAATITSPGPGFFIYFNTNQDLPRLVYSTDLSDPDADLAILGRFPNLGGSAGFALLPTITAINVSAVPEPSNILLTSAGALLLCGTALRRRLR